jgi:hypothetical protein
MVMCALATLWIDRHAVSSQQVKPAKLAKGKQAKLQAAFMFIELLRCIFGFPRLLDLTFIIQQ